MVVEDGREVLVKGVVILVVGDVVNVVVVCVVGAEVAIEDVVVVMVLEWRWWWR